jgi:SAM-dependent methyltransferase
VRVLWPLMPGWPDEGRRIVQTPHFRRLIGRAAEGGVVRCKRVLNAGAGEGSFSPVLLELAGARCIVELDVSYGSRRRAKSDARQQMVAGSLTAIPLADGAFDLILCTEVLEHIEDDRTALDELCRVLAPGGAMLISVPTPPAVYDPDHVREGYTFEELGAMLRERKLELVEADYCMYAAFKAIMRLYRRWGRRLNSLTVRTLAAFDRFCPLGRPMDLMILARAPAASAETAPGALRAAERAPRVAWPGP